MLNNKQKSSEINEFTVNEQDQAEMKKPKINKQKRPFTNDE